MKYLKLNIVSFIVLLTTTFVACVDSLPVNPNNVPEIKIYSPVSNDTVHIGRNYINYSASDYAGGSGLNRFEVVVNDDEDNSIFFNKDTANAFTTIYFDLSTDALNSKASYYVRVYNQEGATATSLKMINLFVGENFEQPETPDSLWIQRINTSEVRLFWKDKALNEDGFTIYRKDGVGGTYVPINNVGENETSFTDRGLSPYVVYYYKIAAYNGGKLSPFTYEVNTLQAGGNEPYNLTVEAQGATRVQLRWKNISYYTESAYIDIERKHPSANLWTKIKEKLVATSEEYVDTKELYPGTSYDYRVTLTIMDNQNEYKFYSYEVTVTTYTIDVPVPENLVATFSPSVNKVLVQWGSYPQHATGTQVWRSNKYDGTYVLVDEVGTDQTYLYDDAIEENNVYYYKARYLTSADFYTAFSEIDSAKVSDFRPLAPSNLRISKLSNSTGKYYLEWEDNSADEEGFNVFGKGTGDADFTKLISVPANQKWVVVDIGSVTSYKFKVQSFKGNLFSVFSNEVTTTESIGGFTLTVAYDRNNNIASLSWSVPQGNVVLYKIERSDDVTNKWDLVATIDASASKNYSDSGLTSKRIVQYRVTALYSDGSELVSNIYEVNTW